MSEFSRNESEGVIEPEGALDDSRQRAKDIGKLAFNLLKDPKKYLSPEELEEYEKAQQSIVYARESAILNEGQIIIF